MQKIPAVEEARELFQVARNWAVWRWLFEKKKARRTADAAVEAFDEVEKKVKAGWTEDMRKAYREAEAEAAVDGNARSRHRYEKAQQEARDVPEELKMAVRRVKEADDRAYEARMDAERIFEEAEKQLSAALSRQGAERALESWDLREKAIRRAEAVARRK
jgi:hypothetical protein